MAKIFKFICDGCDTSQEVQTEQNPFNNILVRIGRDEPGNPIVGLAFDLCDGCYRILTTKCNPKSWHKGVKAMEQSK